MHVGKRFSYAFEENDDKVDKYTHKTTAKGVISSTIRDRKLYVQIVKAARLHNSIVESPMYFSTQDSTPVFG